MHSPVVRITDMSWQAGLIVSGNSINHRHQSFNSKETVVNSGVSEATPGKDLHAGSLTDRSIPI